MNFNFDSKTLSYNSDNSENDKQMFCIQNGIITMRQPMNLDINQGETNEESGFKFWNEIQKNPDFFEPHITIGKIK